MTRRGPDRPGWAVAGLLAVGVLMPLPASAQQWYELYSDGVAALRSGRGERAVDLLRRAIEKRPRPGVRVPTYGTNFEPQYFPYLRLAEAYLLLDAGEKAAGALETSARLDIEPPEERAALEARVRRLVEARRAAAEPTPTPPPTPTPAPTPTPTPAPTPTALSPPLPEGPAAAPATVAPTTSAPSGPPSEAPRAEAVRDRVVPAQDRPPAPPSPRATGGSLEVTSDPPGAQVFIDDEPVGRTDPETGRLKLRTLSPGRHRVRLAAEDRDDLIRQVDIATEPVTLVGVLPRRAASSAAPEPVQPPASPQPAVLRPLLGLVVVLGLAVGLWVWRVGRQPVKRGAGTETPLTVEGRPAPGTDEVFPMPFGDYSLVRRLGKGGMAAVYEAVRRGDTFALKRPLAGFLDDDRFRERFLREAELGRTLHHPNIIRIHDRGQVGDTPYFAMELVHGETLRARLDREGRVDAKLAARVTAQVAEALDYAHNKGVIHRDLKPSNIMLNAAGDVKVMDYGIARAQRMGGLTTTGSFLGTPSYAAPEAVDAGTQPQSDIYSLGVVLFEMLTGSLPFTGENAFAVLRGHCSTPPPTPSSLNFAIPGTLDRLVLRLLSKTPSDRPSAEDLLNELADFLRSGR